MELISVGEVFDAQLAAVAAAHSAAQRVRACARLENAACAARLAAMADMLHAAHAADGSAERDQWRIDNWAAVCAAIGAAHDVTSGVANTLLTDAVTLRERLPHIAALFAAGTLSYRQVHQICSRTALVQDPTALAAIDAELAALFGTGRAMSVDAAEKAIDAAIWTHDPHAVRRTQTASRGHYLDVRIDDASGTGHLDACLSVTAIEAVNRRADAMAATVCHRDPRTRDERRADAMGAIGFGWDHLPCLCQSPDCDAATTPRVGGIIVHVITRPDTLPTPTNHNPHDPSPDDGPSPNDGSDDGGLGNPTSNDDVAAEADPEPTQAPQDAATERDRNPTESGAPATECDHAPIDSDDAPDPAPEPTPPPPPPSPPAGAPIGELSAQRRALVGGPQPLLPRPWYTYTWSALSAALHTDPGQMCPARPGVILGGAVLPAPVLSQAAMHATIKPLIHPGQAPPEPRYRPSQALAEFIRCRDLTCRFPGCTRPATICDVDHTIAHPWGPTQAANLKCLCREHHLLKTFWPGWTDRQLPNGDVIWTDPDGQTYLTQPGSAILFPELCAPTAEAILTGTPPPKHTAGLKMPRRTTTRAHDRARRIHDERRANQELTDNPDHTERDCTKTDISHHLTRDTVINADPLPSPPPDDDDPPPF